MGSSFSDGLKGVDIVDGAEVAPQGYAHHYYEPHKKQVGRGTVRGGLGVAKSLIERTVADTVLTQLLRRHGTVHPPAALVPSAQMGEKIGIERGAVTAVRSAPLPEEFVPFLTHLTEGDFDGALAWLKPWRHPRGAIDDMMAEILAHAARCLGQQWADDELCFAEVSLGIVILQQILLVLEWHSSLVPKTGRRMLLMASEGHCFGIRLLGARFRQAGWDCRCESAMSEQMMLQRAAEARFDVIGISIHNAEGEGRATALVAALRAASMERGVRILLGGSQFKDRPEAVLALGSDLPVLSFAALRVALDHSKPTVFV